MSKQAMAVGDKVFANRAGTYTVTSVERTKAHVGAAGYFERWRLTWCPVIRMWRLDG